MSHSLGIPSVARMSTTTCPGCAFAHAVAWSIAPCSAAEVGVNVCGLACALMEWLIGVAAPGSGAISTAGVA